MRYLLALLLAVSPALAGQRQQFGPGLVQCLAPNGDASTSGWTVAGAATHREATDDAPETTCMFGTSHDGDTTFIQCPSSTSCSDVFNLTNTSGLSGTNILYVTANFACKESSAPVSGNLTLNAVISAVDYSLGTAACATGGSGVYPERFASIRLYTNPATSAAWTTSDIDGMQLKVAAAPGASGTVSVTGIGVTVTYEYASNFGTFRERSGGGD